MLIILCKGEAIKESTGGINWFIVSGGTFLFSITLILINGISLDAFRAIYNYFALFVIPCAVIIALQILNKFPEKLIKA